MRYTDALAAVRIEIPDATLSEMEDIWSEDEYEAALAEAASPFTWEVWDRQSEINGVPAAEVIESHHLKDGQVVMLVKQEGRVLFFQDQSPFGGALSEDAVEDAAQAVIRQISHANVTNSRVPDVVGTIRANRSMMSARAQETILAQQRQIDFLTDRLLES